MRQTWVYCPALPGRKKPTTPEGIANFPRRRFDVVETAADGAIARGFILRACFGFRVLPLGPDEQALAVATWAVEVVRRESTEPCRRRVEPTARPVAEPRAQKPGRRRSVLY